MNICKWLSVVIDYNSYKIDYTKIYSIFTLHYRVKVNLCEYKDNLFVL